jgi:hypothetical protein
MLTTVSTIGFVSVLCSMRAWIEKESRKESRHPN